MACLPDSRAAANIEALAKRLRSQCHLKGGNVGAEFLHIKLLVLGNYSFLPQGVLNMAEQAASSVTMSAFDVSFDHAMTFAGGTYRRPFGLGGNEGLAGVKRLQGVLDLALREAGFARDKSTYYTPHVTLQYIDHLVAERPIEPIGWRVSEFVLVQRGPGDGQHVLERWPLREEPGSPGAIPSTEDPPGSAGEDSAGEVASNLDSNTPGESNSPG